MRETNTYLERKLKLSHELSEFINDDDLTHVANIILIGRLILRQSHFPIKKYKEYKNEK